MSSISANDGLNAKRTIEALVHKTRVNGAPTESREKHSTMPCTLTADVVAIFRAHGRVRKCTLAAALVRFIFMRPSGRRSTFRERESVWKVSSNSGRVRVSFVHVCWDV